ncbi:MAG: peptidoglycan DD-metalloendopeptidase family protein [Clostridia bacterium]|nr:peptidoglycan DD-metalloendopeptidase family protein [Clostridia bacterium]
MNSKKSQKLKKVLIWVLVALMLFPTVVSLAFLVRADEISDLKSELKTAKEEQEKRQALIDEAKEQQEMLTIQLESTEKELDKLREEQASIFDQKYLLDQQIGILNEQIAVIDSTVSELETGIEELSEELASLDEQYAETYRNFKNRLRVSYEDGTASYLSVILSSSSMSDLVMRIQMVSDILANDRKMMEELELLEETVAVKREAYESERAEYIAMTESLEYDRAELQLKVDESIAIMAELANEETANAELLAEFQKLWQEAYENETRLEEEFAAAAEEIELNEAALSSAIQSREEAESRYLAWSISDSIAKAQTTTTSKPKPVTTPPSTSGSSGGNAGNGKYIWPTPGYYWVTSEFGGRYHPVTGVWNSHSGIDIGAAYGSKVIAVASGRVIESGYSYWFGNCIRIDHGNGMVSLYGHFMSPALYSVGEWVNQGATIGYVGSTGQSTGPHLHITIKKDGVNVDPLKYLTK